MCGIVGILGHEPVAPRLCDALKRLEYRGYDSAGIATVRNGALDRRRAVGKLANLEGLLARDPLEGSNGIGHTRWATHGAPTEGNAHPHATDRVTLVHNGIIENFRELRGDLEGSGIVFESDTDTEVIARLVTHLLDQGETPESAIEAALKRLDGAFALAVLFKGEDGLMIGARRGSPLAIGHGTNEMYLGSDAMALAPLTNRISYLEDGDWAVLRHDSVSIRDADGRSVERPVRTTSLSAEMVGKGNHRHFMVKEIHEQPEMIGHTLTTYLDAVEERIRPPSAIDFSSLRSLMMSACGTAFYAGLVSRYWFESLARLPLELDIASEFRYREPVVDPSALSVFISQSGETADTLAALRYCAEQGSQIAAIVNVPESSIAREANELFPTHAGPEIGVASTKAFTCQLTVLAAMAIAAGRARGVLTREDEVHYTRMLTEVPGGIAKILQDEKQYEALGHDLSKARDVLYLGRGVTYPIALEGALKLKEISYIHAEGYAAGELKHGPIALIDDDVPVIVLAPSDRLFEKTVSNMQEVAARGGKVVLISDAKGLEAAGKDAWRTIEVPPSGLISAPLLYVVPVQLIAYYTAIAKGTDVDQPRNLAKSVTVE